MRFGGTTAISHPYFPKGKHALNINDKRFCWLKVENRVFLIKTKPNRTKTNKQTKNPISTCPLIIQL